MRGNQRHRRWFLLVVKVWEIFLDFEILKRTEIWQISGNFGRISGWKGYFLVVPQKKLQFNFHWLRKEYGGVLDRGLTPCLRNVYYFPWFIGNKNIENWPWNTKISKIFTNINADTIYLRNIWLFQYPSWVLTEWALTQNKAIISMVS